MRKIAGFFLAVIIVFIALSYIYNDLYSRSVVLSPQKVVSQCRPFLDNDKRTSVVRILVVDGGGIDGIMPLVVLRYLEEKTGKPASELFDFFTGTSTGSIIVTALNIPEDMTRRPKFSADKLLEMYKNFSKEVLSPSLARKIFTLHGVIGPHLSVEHLHEEFIRLTGGEVTFGGLLKKVVITAYDIERNKPVLFNSWECDSSSSRYLVADIITASTSTPTFFSPTLLTDLDHQSRNALVDGMIFANNPSLDALREAFALYPNAQSFIIVHLGTGGSSLKSLKLSATKIQRWGFIHWIKPLATILYKSQNLVIKDAIGSIQDFTTDTQFEYYQFNKDLDYAAPFDTSQANINTIIENANAIIKEQGTDLDKVAQIIG